ncbi:MAG: hypothetical protein ACTSUZ_04635 [Candidatus Thorarchaeota archaeon]
MTPIPATIRRVVSRPPPPVGPPVVVLLQSNEFRLDEKSTEKEDG